MMYLNQSNHTPYMGHCVLLKAEPQKDGTSVCTVADCSGEVEVIVTTSSLPFIEAFGIPHLGIPTELFMDCYHGVPVPMKMNVGKGRETLSAIPAASCPETHKLYHMQLMSLLHEHVTDPRCNKLLHDVLTDEYIAPQFQTVPASKDCHHSEEGGLLRHTLEVVKEVSSSPTFASWNRNNRSLALTVAALHDIGKCHNRHGAFRYCCIAHEDRALELIAPYLSVMDETWSEGSELIRLCLVRQPIGNGESTIRTLVKSADHTSASNDASKNLFDSAENWKSVVKGKGTNNRLYHRLV